MGTYIKDTRIFFFYLCVLSGWNKHIKNSQSLALDFEAYAARADILQSEKDP